MSLVTHGIDKRSISIYLIQAIHRLQKYTTRGLILLELLMCTPGGKKSFYNNLGVFS